MTRKRIKENFIDHQMSQLVSSVLVISHPGQVLLISDETTDKAAAALDVEVGSLSDPADLPGLAHFCEHMLFLGTERYPDEDSLGRFLSWQCYP